MNTKKLKKITKVLKDWLVSIYLYKKDDVDIPVFVLSCVDFVFLDSIRSFFSDEQFIILTEDDIYRGNDVFCLKLLHIKQNSTLFYGKDLLSTIHIKNSDLRFMLELEIRNKLIQLREGYLSQNKWKYFLKDLLLGMEIIWEWALWLKNPDILLPKNIQELISLFDVAWSCNSSEFYYLIDDKIDKNKIPQFIHYVQIYLLDLCTKINDYKK